jgi:membrane fusion protein, heavy metal efflux system
MRMNKPMYHHFVLVTALVAAASFSGCESPVRAAVPAEGGDACCPSEAPAAVRASEMANENLAGEHGAAEEHAAHGHGHGEGHAERHGVLWCAAHDVAEMECGICQPQRLAGLATGEGMKVRFPSLSSLEKAGVKTGAPENGRRPGSNAPILGQVTFNRNALAVVSPRADGVVDEVYADVGGHVEAGGLLATVNAPAVAEAKAAFFNILADAQLARQVHTREKDLHERGISARKDLEEASAKLETMKHEIEHARLHLINLGLTEGEVDAVAENHTATSRLPIRAPFAGTVVDRLAVPGTRVETGAPLFEVADLSEMWMELSVPESRLAHVQEGARIQARFEAYPNLTFEGTLTWLGYRVDPRTRMVEARAVLPNGQGLLRDGMFGEAELSNGTQTAGLSVPESAVQEIGGRNVVFTRVEGDLFESRLVQLGEAGQGRVSVLAGLSHSDEVALTGSYILKSEFLKSRFGAGCAEH